MMNRLKEKIFKTLLNYDQQQFAKKLKNLQAHIFPGNNVLDVGCGSGRFSKFISDRFSCEVTGMDTIDYLAVNIPFIKYAGGEIPLDNHVFDLAFCIATIHHTSDPEQILREVCRVAKKVILIEDYCSTRFGKLGLHLNDYFVNIFQNLYKCWCGYHPWSVYSMQWRLRFQTETELRSIFQRNNIRLLSFHRTSRSWKGMSHGVYVLTTA